MLDSWLMILSNRPAHYCVSGVDGTSRFSHVKFPCVPGAFDRAEPDRCSRLRIHRCCLLHFETASTLWFQVLSRLNALPACHPVNPPVTPCALPTYHPTRRTA